ncbi:MAG: FAD-dependent oxidoreductase [Bauldia sp.]
MADADVIVAGGGPAGLLVAYLCAEAGIDVRVFDAAPALAQDLRATSFHPPTLDMLDELGITAKLVARGMVCPSWQIRSHPDGDRAVFELATIAGETRHPFRLQCEQWKLSEELLHRLNGHPHATVSFGSRVTGFTADADGVTVTVESLLGEEKVRGRILVGADGSRSTVRAALGIPFEGETYPETTVVVTTPFRFEDHLEGMSMVTSCWTRDSHIAFLRLPDLWRLALYPDESLSIEEQSTPEAVEAVLQAVVPQPEPYPVFRIWPYRVQQRIVPSYRAGRVVLLGDAAHVNSPAGGMGLNAAIHDAFELATGLRAIFRDGAAPDARLDLYERRRRPVMAESVLGQAATNRARMRVNDPAERRAELARLKAIAADPEKHKAFVMRASMIDGLRKAAMAS